MGSLETDLKKIEKLVAGLNANSREEESHYTEFGWTSNNARRADMGYSIDGGRFPNSPSAAEHHAEEHFVPRKIIDKPAEPDMERRNMSKRGLQQIYGSSEFYSVKYIAGMALGKQKEIKEKLSSWRGLLLSDLNASKTTMEDVYDVIGHSSNTSEREVFGKTGEEPVVSLEPGIRLRAVEDASLLFAFSGDSCVLNLLKESYKNNNFPKVRVQAGKGLGYSGLRIWAHEHPIMATGIGIAGAISGSVPVIMKYFDK